MIKTLTPTVNWNSPLAKGLFFDAPMFERGGLVTRDVAGRRTGVITTATWATNIVGQGINFAGSGADRVDFPMTINKPVQSSLYVLFVVKAYDGTSRRLWELENGGSPNVDLLQMNTTPTFSYGATTSGGADSGGWKITQPSTGVVHSLLLTHDKSSFSNDPVFYLDGVSVPVTKTNTPSGVYNTASQNLIIGNRTLGDSARPFNGQIFSFRIWNRILNAQEAKQLYSDPWQIYLKPIKTSLNTGV